MTPTLKKMVGLIAVIISIYLVLGAFYLPSSFMGEVRNLVLAGGIVLLIAGNILIVFGAEK